MSCMEFTSLLMDVKHWADGVPRDSHPPAVGRWKNESDNFDKLLDAFKSVFEQRLAEERRAGGQSDAARRRYTNPASPYQSRERGPYGDEPQTPQRRGKSTARNVYAETDEPHTRACSYDRGPSPVYRDERQQAKRTPHFEKGKAQKIPVVDHREHLADYGHVLR